MTRLLLAAVALSLTFPHLLIAADPPAAAATPSPSPNASARLFERTPALDLVGKHDFTDAAAISDDAAGELPRLCSLKEFRALPEAERHVYSFDVWPDADDKLGVKAFTFNFHLGDKGVTREKIVFTPTGGGPNSKQNLTRVKDANERFALRGIGNLDWGGNSQHQFRFEKPVLAFGVVLKSTADVGLQKFYWASNKEQNGFPVSYTLADGTLVNLGEREKRGALIKGETPAFVGVIDRSGRGIVSVSYTLKGLGGNKAQGIQLDHIAFVTMPKPEVSPVISLRSSCDFPAPDTIAPSPSPMIDGLTTLEDFRFIVANKRSVYSFDVWPAATKDLGKSEGEFSFDLKGKGATDQKISIKAANAGNNARLVQASLKSEDDFSYSVLGGLGDIAKGAWAEQTIRFEKPVWAFGVTYRSPNEAKLADASADGKTFPVSYTLADGTVVNLGTPGTSAGALSMEGKTFVGVIDKTDKGIVSATVRVQGSAPAKQPLYIEDVAFALAGPPPGNWKLVLEDNFDGDKLNPEIWAPGYTFKDIINNEFQAYVPENITVANGICTIKVEKRDAHNMDRTGRKGPLQKFASGAFTSYDKFTATFGYFETRVRMPRYRGAGVWPAFWMLPDRGRDYPDDKRATYRTKDHGTGIEIDIFEFMPRWRRDDGGFPVHVGCIWSYGAVTEKDPAPHGYGAYALDNDGWGPKELTFKNLDTEYHTYGLYWSPERLIWYLDGKPVFRVKDPVHVPDVPHYFLFNIALSGNGWGKSPDKSNPKMEDIIADMPNAMEIDYFRAYSGTLDEAVPASPTDDPSIVPKYTPPPKNAPAATPAATAAPTASPTPADNAPAAPINSTIESPSNG